MQCRVLLLLVLAAAAACEPAHEPRAEPPPAPLVIGTSPPGPIAPEAEPTTPDEPVAAAASPLAVPARDPRAASWKNRARALIITELQGLVSLFDATPPTAPDRPLLARRIADTYAELARAAVGTPVATNAHKSSAKYYAVLTGEHPSYADLDEAYYYAALEHELAGDKANARRAYYELIKKSPGSKLIPFAYFAFGEMFFVDAETDPSKYQLAEQAYREVLKYPPVRNVLYVEAHKRLAEINLRLGAGPIRRP
jgi:tetratricopeptide (TPR) repeat protein